MTKTLAFILSASLAACAGEAEVRYSGDAAAPELIAMDTDPSVMVVANADEPIFFVENTYYLYRNDRWYRSRSHRDGWKRVDAPPDHIRRIDRPLAYVHFRHGQERTTYNQRDQESPPAQSERNETGPMRDPMRDPARNPNSDPMRDPTRDPNPTATPPYPNPPPPNQVPPGPDRDPTLRPNAPRPNPPLPPDQVPPATPDRVRPDRQIAPDPDRAPTTPGQQNRAPDQRPATPPPSDPGDHTQRNPDPR